MWANGVLNMADNSVLMSFNQQNCFWLWSQKLASGKRNTFSITSSGCECYISGATNLLVCVSTCVKDDLIDFLQNFFQTKSDSKSSPICRKPNENEDKYASKSLGNKSSSGCKLCLLNIKAGDKSVSLNLMCLLPRPKSHTQRAKN